MQPDSLSRFASERLKDDHDGIRPEDDGTATLEPESITIRPLREEDVPAVELLAELEEHPCRRGRCCSPRSRGRSRPRSGSRAVRRSRTRSRKAQTSVSLLHVRAAQLRAA